MNKKILSFMAYMTIPLYIIGIVINVKQFELFEYQTDTISILQYLYYFPILLVITTALSFDRIIISRFKIFSFVFAHYVLIYWVFVLICPKMLLAAIVLTIMSVLTIILAIKEDDRLIIVNPTKYGYFDYCYFFACNRKKTTTKTGDNSELIKMVDNLKHSFSSEIYSFTNNNLLGELLYNVRTHTFNLTQEELKYIDNRLDGYLCIHESDVYDILEIKALLKKYNNTQ